jgi:hypothetical protein
VDDDFVETLKARDLVEVAIRGLEVGAMVPSAGRDQQITCRNCHAHGSCAAREVVGCLPYIRIDGQLRENSLEVA